MLVRPRQLYGPGLRSLVVTGMTDESKAREIGCLHFMLLAHCGLLSYPFESGLGQGGLVALIVYRRTTDGRVVDTPSIAYE